MNFGPMFANHISRFIKSDRIAVLNLSKNTLGDDGVILLMRTIVQTLSLVSLNLSSNEITAIGFSNIFDAISTNQSVVHLNLSTYDGVNRNRLSKKAVKKFKTMLLKNQILDTLYFQGVSFGNDGMSELVKAFNFGLDDMVKAGRAKQNI
jgi:Ran GTPase-activating protein (RanGAP) involved in mRNA processing and transport